VSVKQANLRLVHPDLDFWVDDTAHEPDGRFMATADLGRTRGMSGSGTRR
jgi:hypothetical protein